MKMIYQSTAGYFGAIFFALFAVLALAFDLSSFQSFFWSIFIIFVMMAIYEIRAQFLFFGGFHFSRDHRSFFTLARSAFVRWSVNFSVLCFCCFLVDDHRFFSAESFDFTRYFYHQILSIYFYFGFLYHFIALRLRGGFHYDLGDYAILTLCAVRAIGKVRFNNRRIKKILLVHLVNFFFLTLMISFFNNEFSSLKSSFSWFSAHHTATFFQYYHQSYLVIYHGIFVVDVGLAVISYTIANRFLMNRTKSVDSSLYGWLVVLLCYPPMNSGFTAKFISYSGVSMPLPEWLLMFTMPIILASFFVYVFATAAMGFKFSNLTNRGIVSIGPYRFFRHPAYIAKNFAWWVDNLQVFNSFWAFVSIVFWTKIYLERGITEEKHLSRDSAYCCYCARVPRWFPRWQ